MISNEQQLQIIDLMGRVAGLEQTVARLEERLRVEQASSAQMQKAIEQLVDTLNRQ